MYKFVRVPLSLPRFAVVTLCLLAATASAQRQMEKLDRGVIAVRSSTSQVCVGWRLLATDPPNTGFNVLRSSNGAPARRVHTFRARRGPSARKTPTPRSTAMPASAALLPGRKRFVNGGAAGA